MEGVAWQPQRAVAARNEAKLLEAARELLAGSDARTLDVRDVAEAAGVGVGTLYRRFGSKAGLLGAVVGEDERGLQKRMVSGAPPVGPGAPADVRLDAFLDELIALTERNLGALLVTEATEDGGRLRVPSYHGWRLHVSTLLRQLRPDATPKDLGWVADALLSTVDARLYAFQRRDLRFSQRRIADHVKAMATALTQT